MIEEAPRWRAMVSDRLDRIVEAGDIPGISIVAVDAGGRLHALSAGERRAGSGVAMTSDLRIPMSCVIKPMIAMLVHRAARDRLLSLSASITEYLPELLTDRVERPITIAHLLSHTAGYCEPGEPTARWTLSWERFVAEYCARRQAFRPGTAWSYSHTGFVILARILEAVTQRPVLTLLNELILGPLGISAVVLDDPSYPTDAFSSLHVRSPRTGRFEAMRKPPDTSLFRYSLSDLTMSTVDIARFGAYLAGSPTLQGDIDPEPRLRLLSGHFAIPPLVSGSAFEHIPTSFRLGIGQYGGLPGVNGSFVGSTCALRFDPKSQIAFAVTINSWLPLMRERITRLLVRSLAIDKQCRVRPMPRVNPASLVGDYHGLMLGSAPARIVHEGETTVLWLGHANRETRFAQLGLTSDGRLKVTPITKGAAVGVFKPSGAREHALMIGTSAFVRRAT